MTGLLNTAIFIKNKEKLSKYNQMKIAGPNRTLPPLSIIKVANKKRRFP